MAEGKKVEVLARKIFPEGILIDHDNGFDETVAQSQEAIKRATSNTPIFNALLTAGTLVAETDILLPIDDEFEIYEVKSSTEEKEDFIPDIAYQKYVAEQAGLKIKATKLVTINSKFINNGNLYNDPPDLPDNPEQLNALFSINDISDAVDAHFPLIEKNISIAEQVIGLKEPPSEKIGDKCKDCPVKPDCWKDILAEKNNIFTLHRLGKKAYGWHEQGIIKNTEIPSDYSLNDKQKIQIEAEKTGEVYIDKVEVGQFLEQLKYPLYALDFESINPVLPINNSHPYEQIPFQFSLHIVDALDADPTHHSWIWDNREDDDDDEDNDDPRREMLIQLQPLLKDTGSIIAYHASFEKGIL